MNLQTLVKPELWQAVARTYEAGNYTHAIIEATHFLTNVIREKANVGGDGASLVGQALGGNSPKLKINKLQTESERDEQKGIQQIISGMYQGIRNKRSHEQIEDQQADADAVIYFINFLIGILDRSSVPFTIEEFLGRVFEESFVGTDRYAKLLAQEIPASKRVDTLIQIYRDRNKGDGDKLSHMVKAILVDLTPDEVGQFTQVVSDDFRAIDENRDITSALRILPDDLWPQIGEIARLRVENKMIRDIETGSIDPSGDLVQGAFGTWAKNLVPYFDPDSKTKLGQVLIDKLKGDNKGRRYVAKWFFGRLPEIYANAWEQISCMDALRRATNAGDGYFISILLQSLNYRWPKTWRAEVTKKLEALTDKENPTYRLSDGIPLLGKKLEERDLDELDDQIPF
jgi:uncharacterized protein (TIGR02391 family)